MLAATAAASAQNPVVQTCYTTDPAPMVHDDTFYIYTGHDENGADFFWMQEWRVYSSKDMVNWTDHGSPLAIEDFKWADAGPGHRSVWSATASFISMCRSTPVLPGRWLSEWL